MKLQTDAVDQFPAIVEKLIQDINNGRKWNIGSVYIDGPSGYQSIMVRMYRTEYDGTELTLQEDRYAGSGDWTLHVSDREGHYFKSTKFPQVWDIIKALEETRGGRKIIGTVFSDILWSGPTVVTS